MNDTGSGYANACSLDVRQIDAEALATQAMDKALRSRNPVTLEPGDYEVILEEYAVADILSFLAAHSFSGLAWLEGRSNFRPDARIMADQVSIWDDGLSPAGLPMPFDCEGLPKRRIDLVENGVARAVVYDSTTGRRAGKQSTGHGLPVPGAIWPLRPHVAAGPQPAHLFIKTGSVGKEEMVQGIERGLWVTRFNYTRLVHPLEVTVTGTTRGGTFLIENGEISRPVQNLRYTQSYRQALTNVTAIGKEAKVQRHEFGAHCAPALRISNFRFTGVAKDE
jgi:PmbA protein